MVDVGNTIEYGTLTKMQRLAYFLVLVGPQTAARILKDFPDNDVENICREIAAIKLIDRETQNKVLAEFGALIGYGTMSILGGSGFAQQTLRYARGDYKAANIIGRIAPTESTSSLIKEISDMEPRQIYNLMRNEQCQTIAFLVSHLNLDKAVEVVEMLPNTVREEVVERIGSMENISAEMVTKVVQTLRRHVVTSEQQTLHRSGGIRAVADILNALNKDMSKLLLAKLEERNASLGAAIRKKMFSFEDILKLDVSDVQRITRDIEMSDLVIALKSASPKMNELILKSVSKRAAQTLKEEMELLGPVKMREVEAAQERIIQVVRKLEESGDITLDKGNERPQLT